MPDANTSHGCSKMTLYLSVTTISQGAKGEKLWSYIQLY